MTAELRRPRNDLDTDTHAPASTTPAAQRTRDLVDPPARLAVDELSTPRQPGDERADAATRGGRPRARAAEAGPGSRLPAQRLRLLRRHAHARTPARAARPTGRLLRAAVWRETPFFTARERAALELTEAVTRLTEAPVDDAVRPGRRRVHRRDLATDLGDHRHQRLEPARRHRPPLAADLTGSQTFAWIARPPPIGCEESRPRPPRWVRCM